MRKLLLLLALAVIAWAALVVPLPFATLAPVPAQPVASIVDIAEQAPEDIPQDLLFTAVQIRQPTTVGAVEVALDDDRDLTLIRSIVPEGIDQERFIELQRRMFEESIRAAAAVGLRAAGREVEISGEGARIIATVPGAPADGVLQREDVVTGVDGQDVSLASELSAVVSDKQAGEQVELTVQRDGETITRTVELEQLQRTDQVGLGVLVSTVNLQIDLPVEVTPAPNTAVGGPSAGLMIALSVYDAATEDDLVQGRIVAGSGAVDVSGNVRRVSGISEKVAGAVQAGADVFLVPESLAQEARDAAPPGLEVIPVSTVQDAIDALEG